MKLVFSEKDIPQATIFSTFAGLIEYNGNEKESISSAVDRPYIVVPSMPSANSACDDNEIPDQYSPSMGLRYLDKDKMLKEVNFLNRWRDQEEKEYRYTGSSTKKVIEITMQAKQVELNLQRAREVEFFEESEKEFIKNMNILLLGLQDSHDAKRQAVKYAFGLYFQFAFSGLYHAKAKMQEIILKAHAQIAPNKTLIAFEYAIMCCLSMQDFIFDKDITDLSKEQNAYRQALANDSLSGEDDNLFSESLKEIDHYESVICGIGLIFAEMTLTFQQDDERYNALQAELAWQINEFIDMNAHEKFNSPIYIVAEIAMQTLCEALIKYEKIRDVFIADVIKFMQNYPNNNTEVKQDAIDIAAFLKEWICRQEFSNVQSNIRHDILRVYSDALKIDSTNYATEILSHANESLIKMASNIVLQKTNIMQIEEIVEDIHVLFTPGRHVSQTPKF